MRLRVLVVALLPAVLALAGAVLVWAPDSGWDHQRLPEQPTTSAAIPAVPTSSLRSRQGLRGRFVTPAGHPAVGVRVHLTQSFGDVIRMAARSPPSVGEQTLFDEIYRGRAGQVIGSETTDSTGAFELGLADSDVGRELDLHVVTDDFADRHAKCFVAQPGRWRELGTVRLERGPSVRGRVTEAETGAPIAGAIVRMRSSGLYRQMPPGRENGLVARTDADGVYVIRNLPWGNLVLIAEGLGLVPEVRSGRPHQFAGRAVDLQLARAEPLVGLATDAPGRPVVGARIAVIFDSASVPTAPVVRSGVDGRFRIDGLAAGRYRLDATLRDIRWSGRVSTGDPNLTLVLEPALDRLRVRVLGDGGTPLNQYTVADAQFPLRRIQQRSDTTGTSTVRGMRWFSGSLRIDAPGYATSVVTERAGPFDGEPPPLAVRMTRGGCLDGVVQSAAGVPLSGVTVRTFPLDWWDDPVVTYVWPSDVSKATALTDGDGRYRIPLLMAGTYRVVFDHSDHCRNVLEGVVLRGAETVSLPPVRLVKGAAVSGQLLVEGSQVGLTRVYAQLLTPTGQPTRHSMVTFTDGDGQFEFRERAGPGRWLVGAWRSQREFRVEPGEHAVSVDLDAARPR